MRSFTEFLFGKFTNNIKIMHPISKLLISWYNQNKRDLPWRNTIDPYKIWISEIILQQTRVNQGMDYYIRFIERFPNVSEIANADQDELLKYWQGLGYYSRARNIYKAANQIVNDYGGVFPKQYHEVINLAGIGAYTAAAICSFAYNQPYAVVDGNVYRVLSRIFGIDTPIDSGAGVKTFAQIAQSILFETDPGLHNQAIMEFGALQCVPSSPDCENCPLRNDCKAFRMNYVSNLPVKKQKIKVKARFFNYFFVKKDDRTFVHQRSLTDIWQNLYEFPLIESNKLLSVNELLVHDEFLNMFSGIEMLKIDKISTPIKHMLTHRHIYAQFITVTINSTNEKLSEYTEIALGDIDKFAVSRLIEQFLENEDV